MFKMFKKTIKESVQEALIEAYQELTEEECEREREIEACEYEMEIAEGGFRECLEMIDLPKEQKEELARMATNKKQVVAYIDKELDNAIYAMRRYEEYQRLSKSEIVNRLIKAGLEAEAKEETTPA